jgi:hypothetical protein
VMTKNAKGNEAPGMMDTSLSWSEVDN